MIDTDTVTDRLGSVRVIEELIESSHLSRFQGLVCNERAFQPFERSCSKKRPRCDVPQDPKFRIQGTRAFEFSLSYQSALKPTCHVTDCGYRICV